MEYRFVIDYTVDGQQESLEVITDSSNLTQEEAQRRATEAAKPYAPREISNISFRKIEQSDHINTDPETSASE